MAYERDAAEQDVRCPMGVNSILNRVEVKPTTTAERISDDTTHSLNLSYFFDPKNITVVAVDGRVELSGMVKSWNDWEVVAATARGALGVRAVDNRITIICSGIGSHMGYARSPAGVHGGDKPGQWIVGCGSMRAA